MPAEVSFESCVSRERLLALQFSSSLDTFRPPQQQRAALAAIAGDSRSCLTIAVKEGRVVGYASFHPPAPPESWSRDRTGQLLELGAIEVEPDMRGNRLAEQLLGVSMAGGRFDATIVLALIYVWNFDLRRVPLGALGYRRLLERLYMKAGFERFATDDPEVLASPANALMARIGSRTPAAIREEFDRLRLAQ